MYAGYFLNKAEKKEGELILYYQVDCLQVSSTCLVSTADMKKHFFQCKRMALPTFDHLLSLLGDKIVVHIVLDWLCLFSLETCPSTLLFARIDRQAVSQHTPFTCLVALKLPTALSTCLSKAVKHPFRYFIYSMCLSHLAF